MLSASPQCYTNLTSDIVTQPFLDIPVVYSPEAYNHTTTMTVAQHRQMWNVNTYQKYALNADIGKKNRESIKCTEKNNAIYKAGKNCTMYGIMQS